MKIGGMGPEETAELWELAYLEAYDLPAPADLVVEVRKALGLV